MGKFSIDDLDMAVDADGHRPLSPVSDFPDELEVRPRLGFGQASTSRYRDLA